LGANQNWGPPPPGTPVPFWSGASARPAIEKLRAEKEAKDRKKD
jgi:hypothetical protein